MTESAAIKPFLLSSDYTALSIEITESTKKWLCDDLYDAEIAFCEKVRASAEISISDLNSLLSKERGALKDFCIKYIKSEQALDSGQEYNPVEAEHQLGEADETYVGHSQTFLFSFAILFFLLKHKKSHVPIFLKKIRKPNASKYQTAIESLDDAVTDASDNAQHDSR